MSRFHSIAKSLIAFELGGYQHTMDPGDELDVPPTHEYLVSARGLPLAEGASPAVDAKAARSERLPRPVPAPPALGADDAVDGEREREPEPDGVDDEAPPGEIDAQIDAAATAAGRPSRPRATRRS